MSQIITKGIFDNAVSGPKMRLANNVAFRGRNAANLADVSLWKINTSDKMELAVELNAGGFKITNLGAPSSANDVASKTYVDTAVSGASSGVTAAKAIGSNVTISNPGTDTFDDITLSTGEILFLPFQGDPTENGPYVFDTSSTPLVRVTSWDTSGEFTVGKQVYVQQGTAFTRTLWSLNSSITTLGSDSVDFFLTGFDPAYIPSSLQPVSEGASNVGANGIAWNTGFFQHVSTNDLHAYTTTLTINGTSFGLDIKTDDQTGATNSANVDSFTGAVEDGTSGAYSWATGTPSGTGSSGGMQWSTGAASDSAATSGDFSFATGSATTPNNRGNHSIDAKRFLLTGDTLFGGSQHAADPVVFTAAAADMYYNTTSNKYRYYNGSTWGDVGGGSTITYRKETFTLSGTDITNQYVDLAHVAQTDSIHGWADGQPMGIEGSSYEYTVSYTGGAGGNTRISFATRWGTGGVSELVASDLLVFEYSS